MPKIDLISPLKQGFEAQSLREQNEFNRRQNLLKLDYQRKSALFQDAQAINTFLKADDVNSAMGVISNRVNMLEQLGGDSSDTMEIANLIGSDNIQGARDLLDLTEQVGVQQGFLQPTEPSELSQINLETARIELDRLKSGATTRERRVQNSRDVPGGTLVTFSDGSQEFKKFGEEVNQAAIDVAQRDLPKLTSSMQNKQLEFQESANNAYNLADKTALLANKFSKIDTSAGAAGSTREAFLNFVGGQDEVSNLRKDYTRIRNKLITANLPQGPATDKDIELIAAGFPQSTANQAQIVGFLQAMSRGQEAVAKFDEFKSVFLQENGNITRATRNFDFDGQEIKKGERLATAYKRISKNLNPRSAATSATMGGQQPTAATQAPQQASGGLTPEEQAELTQLEQEFGGQ